MAISGADGETHEVSAERRSDWISVIPDESGENLSIAVDEDAVREWVATRADKDAVEPENGIEQVDESGKVVKVVSEKKDGLEITNTDSVAAIGEAVTRLALIKDGGAARETDGFHLLNEVLHCYRIDTLENTSAGENVLYAFHCYSLKPA